MNHTFQSEEFQKFAKYQSPDYLKGLLNKTKGPIQQNPLVNEKPNEVVFVNRGKFSVSFAESIILFSKNSNCQDPHMAILQSPECKSWAMGFSKYTCSLNHPEKHHFHACSDSSCRNCHIFERSNACNPRFKSEVDQFSSILKKLNQTDSSEHREVKCGGKFIGALAILYKDTKCEEEEETFIQISRCQPGPVVSSRLECRGEGELVQHRYGTKDCSGEILSTRPFITRNCTNRVQIVKCGTLIFEPEK